jgi:hypothetical protein
MQGDIGNPSNTLRNADLTSGGLVYAGTRIETKSNEAASNFAEQQRAKGQIK